MLESITGCFDTPCNGLPSGRLSYVNIEQELDPPSMSQAPCIGSVCLLKTSIDLISDAVKPVARRTNHILAHEAANAKSMGEARKDHYIHYPPSHAVDGRPDTAFCSFQGMVTLPHISLNIYVCVRGKDRRYNLSGSVGNTNFRVDAHRVGFPC